MFFRQFFIIWLMLAAVGHAGIEPGWADLPTGDSWATLDLSNPENAAIERLVAEYHRIPKRSKETLAARISALANIETSLGNLASRYQDPQRAAIENLRTATGRKHAYLIELTQMSMEADIPRYFNDISALKDKRFTPMPLRNELEQSTATGTFWGRFWLETLDPCHRLLATWHKAYEETKTSDPGSLDFFLWLENIALPESIPAVTYFNDQELESHRVVIHEGLLLYADSDVAVTNPEDARNLFIIDLKKNIYLATWRQGLFHTSLSLGRPVLGAGLLHARDGLIRTLNFESGHYQPTLEQGYRVILLLSEMGARFAEPMELVFFEGRKKFKVSLKREDLASAEAFGKALREESKRTPLANP